MAPDTAAFSTLLSYMTYFFHMVSTALATMIAVAGLIKFVNLSHIEPTNTVHANIALMTKI